MHGQGKQLDPFSYHVHVQGLSSSESLKLRVGLSNVRAYVHENNNAFMMYLLSDSYAPGIVLIGHYIHISLILKTVKKHVHTHRYVYMYI